MEQPTHFLTEEEKKALIRKGFDAEFHLVGSGHFGSVYRGTKNGIRYALKFIQDTKKEIQKEVMLLKSLKHPYVVSIFNYFDELNCLVMEFVDGSTLLELLIQEELEWPVKLVIARRIASALDYLHQNNIVHRDLRCQNILIEKSTFTPKISDFGISHLRLSSASVPVPYLDMLTPAEDHYHLPEGITLVSEKNDIYFFGIILWKLIDGPHSIPKPRNIPQWLPPEFAALLEKCLSPDYTKRPSASVAGLILGLLTERGETNLESTSSDQGESSEEDELSNNEDEFKIPEKLESEIFNEDEFEISKEILKEYDDEENYSDIQISAFPNFVPVPIQKAVEAGYCTLSLTKYPCGQYFFNCKTCKLIGNEGCCASCARICHSGHKLSKKKYSVAFFCDCQGCKINCPDEPSAQLLKDNLEKEALQILGKFNQVDSDDVLGEFVFYGVWNDAICSILFRHLETEVEGFIRAMFIDAMKISGYRSKMMEDNLLKLLASDPSRFVRESVFALLCTWETRDEKILKALVVTFQQTPTIRREIADYFEEIGCPVEIALQLLDVSDIAPRTQTTGGLANKLLHASEDEIKLLLHDIEVPLNPDIRQSLKTILETRPLKSKFTPIVIAGKLLDDDPNNDTIREMLLQSLRDPDDDVAESAAGKLCHDYHHRHLILPQLISRFERITNPFIARFVGALGFQDQRALEYCLSRKTKDIPFERSITAAVGFIGIRSPEVETFLREKTQSPSSEVRSAAIIAMIELEMRDPSTLSILRDMLNDKDDEVRSMAIIGYYLIAKHYLAPDELAQQMVELSMQKSTKSSLESFFDLIRSKPSDELIQINIISDKKSIGYVEVPKGARLSEIRLAMIEQEVVAPDLKFSFFYDVTTATTFSRIKEISTVAESPCFILCR